MQLFKNNSALKKLDDKTKISYLIIFILTNNLCITHENV